MRKYMSAELNRHETLLRQMGAQVDVINSLMCYVTFDIDGIEVSYVFNVNKKNKYFLERVEPYPQQAGVFGTEEDVIEVIKIDIEQFKNAKGSSNFQSFIETNKAITNLSRHFEDLYLYYNVPKEERAKIEEKIKEVEDIIHDTKEKSERVYFKKNPDTL